MNKNINPDFKKEHWRLLKLPNTILLIILYLILIILKKFFANRYEFSWLFVVLFILAMFSLSHVLEKLLENHCIKNPLSPEQLKKINKLSFYLDIIQAAVMFLFFASLFGFL